ncbi:MAG: (deoxy)nucleoside triphosphate pyrophosphohydrolase [Candidatus Sumerlaea chitinivorans]|nr:(deoxy)nucleoside triphosphate pyrophosphohydrolase [Candidatus Sumerlaea chitinivorans]
MTDEQTKPVVKVVAGIICRDQKVLLARRPAGDPLAGFWEFPGGKVEPGETPQRALERELDEEFGVKVWAGDFVASRLHSYPDRTIELVAYWATIEGEIAQLNAHDDVAWVSPTELEHYPLAPADEFLKEILIVRSWGTDAVATTQEESTR